MKPYREDVPSLSAQYPFGVVLTLPEKAIILIPARSSQSSYQDARILDESSIRRILWTFRADFTVVNGIRRLLVDETSFASHPNLLTGHQVVEAAIAATVAGHIFAVVAEPRPEQRAHDAINYLRLAARFFSADPAVQEAGFFAFLYRELPRLCCDAYAQMSSATDQIVQLNDQGYEFLFDVGAERVVAAFGITRYNPGSRDSARMAGFLGQAGSTDLQRIILQAGSAQGARNRLEKAQLTWRDRFFQAYGHHYDRGHFISHRQGGGLDINLFPQLADINQGRTRLGAEYRAMEKACVAKHGVDPVFCCSRPIYNDDSWVPVALEYAVIYSAQRIEFRTFPNRPSGGRRNGGGADDKAGDAA
ncbi:hypothetical protein JQ615_35685 [Bradyrhizobium jicamae]|uniref:Uncharacterized protein n=1 Tax=Bradyrhizobium jicamae TaxID=280332 RepID=A0ABS5FV88_9BRAD|nr:hypothetical protein [Bradyrhizobium jicamae]MBR0800717.1 hypothetical protein [Bradyrhizobium jicamae]MBR0936615.1 hypothetical protein [Bradyrhizobium jicamae]